MQKPRVLHIASWFPSEAHPTLGNFVERHIECFAAQTESKILYATAYAESKTTRSQGAGFEKLIIYYNKRFPLLSYLWALSGGYKKIIKAGFKPDVVHLHVTYPAGILCLFLPRPFVVTEHFTGYHRDSPTRIGFWKRLISKEIHNRALLILPVSRNLGQSLRSIGVHTSMHKLSNVVDTRLFRYSGKELAGSRPFRFFHLSSLYDATKNITGMVRAFARYLQTDNDTELWIGGDGDLTFLQSLLNDHGVPEKNYRLIGSSTPAKVAEYFRQTDCFVLFSNAENQPVVILESLCCGNPVIATRVGGIAEEVNPDNGILVLPRDEPALVQAMRAMKEKYHLYHREDIATEAARKYSRESVSEEYSNVLRWNLGR